MDYILSTILVAARKRVKTQKSWWSSTWGIVKGHQQKQTITDFYGLFGLTVTVLVTVGVTVTVLVTAGFSSLLLSLTTE